MSDLIATLATDCIYKLLRGDELRALQLQGQTRGSPDDERDGYVHLSTAEQVAGTLQRYFSDALDLWLLALDPVALGQSLRWEPSRGGQLFPHLYAPLRWTECRVVGVRERPGSGWCAFSGRSSD